MLPEKAVRSEKHVQDKAWGSAETGLHEDLKGIPRRAVGAATESRLVVMTNPHSPGADRFRHLRNALRQQRMAAKLRSIVVVSPLPQDGKTTVLMNLATALAEGGRESVLCIEADVYNPTIGESLSYIAPVGLAECIMDEVDPLSALVRFDPLHWYFLSAGQKRNNPSEILQPEAIAGMLRKLERHFDWILLDTPPLVPIRDTVGLIAQTDGALLVVRAGRTSQDLVEESLELIGRQHALGIVLNASSELDENYGKYGSYYKR